MKGFGEDVRLMFLSYSNLIKKLGPCMSEKKNIHFASQPLCNIEGCEFRKIDTNFL